MTMQEHLQTIAVEECGELAQRISKALRFGMKEVQPDATQNPLGLTNEQRIYEEFYDLRAMLGMCGIDAWDTSKRAREAEAKKVDKVRHFLEYSRSVGTLTE